MDLSKWLVIDHQAYPFGLFGIQIALTTATKLYSIEESIINKSSMNLIIDLHHFTIDTDVSRPLLATHDVIRFAKN